MAILPKIVSNFNENDTSTIRDYSENGNEGSGTGLTIVSSARVGNEAVFNAVNDQIDYSNITALNGASTMSLHLGIKITGSLGTKNIVDKSAQIEVIYNNTDAEIEVSLFVATGTAFVEAAVAVDTYADIDIVYAANVLTIFVDGVSIDTDATKSGVIDSNANRLFIGDEGSITGELFVLNEFKLYKDAITTNIITAVIAEQNGVLSDSGVDGEFNVGDIIATDINDVVLFGIVTFQGTNEDFRFIPVSDNWKTGQVVQRVGHLWDTTRQHSLKIDQTPEICFYDAVSLSAEVLTTAKEVLCIGKDGILEQTISVTGAVTLDDGTEWIEITPVAAFTIKLPASPTKGYIKNFVDVTGITSTHKITIDGNGKNIDATTTYDINSNYETVKMRYNGTKWNKV